MIIVKSNNLTKGELKNKESKIRQLESYGYPAMAILHFMGEEGSASMTYEEGKTVITVD